MSLATSSLRQSYRLAVCLTHVHQKGLSCQSNEVDSSKVESDRHVGDWEKMKQRGTRVFQESSDLSSSFQSILQVNSSRHSYCRSPLRRADNGDCYFPCGEWTWLPAVEERSEKPVLFLEAIVHFLIGVAVVITWIKLRHTLWQFPHIMSFYMMVNTFLFGLTDVAEIISSESDVHCTHQDLLESVKNPSSYCIIISMVFQYTILSFTCWWICSAINLWQIIRRPSQARFFSNRAKVKVHIIESLISWLLPAVLVSVPYMTGTSFKGGVDHPRCAPASKELAYVTLGLPMQLGSFLLVVLLSDVAIGLNQAVKRRRKLQTESSNSMLHANTNQVNEIRVLRWRFYLLAIMTPIVSTLLFICFGLKARNFEVILFYVKEYYNCLKNQPDSWDCPQTFLDYQYPVFTIISRLVLILYSITLLPYVFLSKEARSVLPWSCCVRRHRQNKLIKDQSSDVHTTSVQLV
ncbi:uncharacterized protein LOC134184860 isoform X2 [Corticium candelabrum]|uniref:uncharacterized protein LOC134184860 isoform X2 n=1 Tax=Corticium candelabrum TaxID=121492 RepID=UPI002E268DD6|nr:uncharacterized protein LOC134184860 isoform X2 [Corticium candelabrum]